MKRELCRAFLPSLLVAVLAADFWSSSSVAQVVPTTGRATSPPGAAFGAPRAAAGLAITARPVESPPGSFRRALPFRGVFPIQPRAGLRRLPAADDPGSDRMMITLGGMRIDAVLPPGLLREPGRCPGIAVRARAEGSWREAGVLRVRVNYLRPEGFSRADAAGLHFDAPEYHGSNPDVVLPRRYWGSYAVYHPGDRVGYEIELENTGTETLTGLSVTAWQEEFNPAGGEGRRFPSAVRAMPVAPLAPGGRVALRGRLTIAGPWATWSNFEQTHLRIARAASSSPTEPPALIADLPQAGIVDPPRP